MKLFDLKLLLTGILILISVYYLDVAKYPIVFITGGLVIILIKSIWNNLKVVK